MWGRISGSENLACEVPCWKVMLLSGRSCSQIFNIEEEGVQDVLRLSAELLDMDPQMVERSGTLVFGSTVIKDLKERMPAHT